MWLLLENPITNLTKYESYIMTHICIHERDFKHKIYVVLFHRGSVPGPLNSTQVY